MHHNDRTSPCLPTSFLVLMIIKCTEMQLLNAKGLRVCSLMKYRDFFRRNDFLMGYFDSIFAPQDGVVFMTVDLGSALGEKVIFKGFYCAK